MSARRQLAFTNFPAPPAPVPLSESGGEYSEFDDPVLRAEVMRKYDADDVDAMTEDQYGDWIESLGQPRFFALMGICFDQDEKDRVASQVPA